MVNTTTKEKKISSVKAESVDSEEVTSNPAKEAALTRKIDWHLLPILTLLYLLSFLDR
jgi:hypothetical protein